MQKKQNLHQKTPKNNKNPIASIIIPAFNEETYISLALSSILRLDYPKDCLEVIVIDNNSSDNTFQKAAQFTDQAFILKNGNVGAVRNFGARKAKGEILCFIDADCIVPSNWINVGLKTVLSGKIIAGGGYKRRSDANWVERHWLLENPQRPTLQKDLLGGCIILKKADFFAVNGFDEKMTSGEDSDLSRRFRNLGYEIAIKEELSVVHLGNPNRLWTFFKRQIWHSENYLQFPKDSFKDPTFILCAFFLTLILVLIGAIFSGNLKITFLTTSLLLLIPTIFSTKRIIYSHFKISSIREVIQIYILDLIYIFGKAAGILKSASKIIYSLTRR